MTYSHSDYVFCTGHFTYFERRKENKERKMNVLEIKIKMIDWTGQDGTGHHTKSMRIETRPSTHTPLPFSINSHIDTYMPYVQCTV